jgi:hypothetical protein
MVDRVLFDFGKPYLQILWSLIVKLAADMVRFIPLYGVTTIVLLILLVLIILIPSITFLCLTSCYLLSIVI